MSQPARVYLEPRARARAADRRFGIGGALLLLGAAFLLRVAQFHNPIDGLDEQFYFVAGDRLLHGALPYVEIWDRKPFGLFALFAALRLIGGGGMIAVKIAATLCAAATAMIVTTLAVRTAPRWAALLAGLFYLIAVQQLWGSKPQTAVFYNLPIAFAFWLAIDTTPALDQRSDRWRICGAMVLAGLAIQIKTNAVFEGDVLGLWLVWRMIRAGAPMAHAAVTAVVMTAIGLAPTLCVAIGYAAIGHFPDFWFANIQSQFAKHGVVGDAALRRAWGMAELVAPMAIMATIGLRRAQGMSRWTPHLQLVALWSIAAAVDAVAIGGFWPHYALPLAVPAAILSAHAFAAPRWGIAAFGILAAYPVFEATVLDPITARDEEEIVAHTVAAIPQDAATQCLFIYEGQSIYYDLTHACLVTKYAFSDHLRSSAEADALPEPASVALRAALARRPGTILTVEQSLWTERNRANDAIMATELARHYRAVARLPQRHYSTGREWVIVWRRGDLLPHDARSRASLVRQL